MEGQEGGSTVETTPLPPAQPPVTSPSPPPPAPETASQSTSLPPSSVSTPVDPSPATSVPPVPASAPPATSAPPPVSTAGPLSLSLKKKRGRPRKYGPDGSLVRPLNATPISASVPALGGEYTPAAYVGAKMKRGRGKPLDFPSRFQFTGSTGGGGGGGGFRLEGLGDATTIALSANSTFTPHVLTVAPGEDVTMKIISFSQQGPRAICILSANGVISNVTLRQPDSSGGTLTYEGRFELLSLSGSFMPSENRSRSGGMSVSLAGPDGRVVGGSVAGLLVAAGPVQIVVGSFLQSYQTEHHQKPVKKAKKHSVDIASVSSTIHSSAIPISSVEVVHNQPKVTSGVLSFRGENWPSPLQQLPPDSRNSVTGV